MANLHPSAVISKSAQIDNGVMIGPNCVIGDGVYIGSGTVFDANVFVGDNVIIGRENHLFANCAIGCTPQILGWSADSKAGRLTIGDGNIFRENVTIHPSRYEDGETLIGNENFLMVGVHIAHDCIVEDNVVISNAVIMGGHCKIETGAWLSGMVAMHQFVTIGRWCFITGMAGVNRDIPPFLVVSGHYPAKIRGVNKRGMQRAGLSKWQQQQIIDAYKKLYHREGTLLANAEKIAQQEGLDENVRAMVETIIKSSQHQFGRYLEKFRR